MAAARPGHRNGASVGLLAAALLFLALAVLAAVLLAGPRRPVRLGLRETASGLVMRRAPPHGPERQVEPAPPPSKEK